MPYRHAYKTQSLPLLDRWLFKCGAYASLLLGLSAVALIWAGTAYFTEGGREQTERAAYQNAANLSRAFEEHIIRSIRSADQTLIYVRDAYVRDPDGFNIALWSQNSAFLTGFNFQVVIIGKDGRMVASNIAGATPGLDLSDREHFKVHTTHTNDELFISKPVLGRVSNKWSIQLTRRIVMQDGSFGGVAVVSISPDYLSQFYQSIDVGERGAITLAGMDGIVRSRGAREGNFIGQSISKGPLPVQLLKSDVGTYQAQSVFDGQVRLYAYRKVRDYPLVLTVGLAKDEVFASYYEVSEKRILTSLALTVWLAGITWLMWRYERALARARDAAEAGTRARSEFLAMMSHEIRTPMNGVVGMSEVLADSGLNDEQLGYARTLRRSADHLLQLINDVLDFSKLDAGRVEIEEVAFDPREVVEGSVGVLAATAQEKGLTLKVDVAADVPSSLVGDPARLRQVLFNLVGNGLKFTPQGGVSVKVSVAQGAVTPGRVGLVFAVSDTGIGIPADGIPLLFQEFSQLDSSVARRFGGTGLGLAICRRLVGLMGGTIAIESAVGKGTTFSFTIQCKLGAPSQKPAPQRAALAAPADKIRILLVEDNQTNQVVATKLLARFGHVPDVANDGLEALERCRVQAYDLIFMDVMMPGMDGLSATRAIRELPAPNGAPHIIALTANAYESDRQMCFEAGMDDFLSKPVTRDQLGAALNRFSASHDLTTIPQGEAPALVPAMAEPSNDPQLFDRDAYAALLDAIGTDGMEVVMSSFLGDTPERLAVARRAAKERANGAVKIEVHAIKSSAAQIGFVRLSQLAKSLEGECLGLSWPDLDARLGELSAAFAAIEQTGAAELAALSNNANVNAGEDHG